MIIRERRGKRQHTEHCFTWDGQHRLIEFKKIRHYHDAHDPQFHETLSVVIVILMMPLDGGLVKRICKLVIKPYSSGLVINYLLNVMLMMPISTRLWSIMNVIRRTTTGVEVMCIHLMVMALVRWHKLMVGDGVVRFTTTAMTT